MFIWPFWSIFNLIQYKNIIFSPFREKNFRKSLADFPLRGGGEPPISAKGFSEKWFSVEGGTPLTEKIS